MTRPQGLLDIVSRIEKEIDQSEELGVLLQKADSEYKLIDSKFRAIDRKRWIGLTDADARSIFVRLVRVSKACRLTVSYSERKFSTDIGLAWDLVSFHIKIENKRKELSDARRRHAPSRELKILETGLNALRLKHRETIKRRIGQRFILLAVRYNLIDPSGMLFDENETYLAEVRGQKWFERADTSFSGNLQGTRSRSPGVSRHATENRSMSQILESEGLNKTKDGRKGAPQTSTTADTTSRNTETTRDVIDHFKTPVRRRMGRDTVEVLGGEEQALEPSPIPADEIQARFQAPRRSVTSQSLIRVHETGPELLKRARTLNPNFDLEAQTKATMKDGKVASTTDPRGIPRIPTFTIQASKDEDQMERRGFDQRKVQSPHIFREQIGGRSTPPSSLAVAPLRLPPLAGATEFSSKNVGPKQPPTSSLSTPVAPPQPIKMRGNSQGKGIASGGRASTLPTPLSPESTASKLMSHRKIKDIKQLQPFFQWRRPAAPEPSTPRATRPNDIQSQRTLANGSAFMAAGHASGEKLAEDILEILDTEMKDRYLISDDFAIHPHHYNVVQEKTIDQVLKAFDKNCLGIRSQSQMKHPTESQKFSETKLSIFLKVDTILSYFVGNNELESVLVRKAWGVVINICELSLEDVSYRFPQACRRRSDPIQG